MKRILLASALFLLCFYSNAQESCTNEAVQQPAYGTGTPFSISGKIAGHDGVSLQLCKMQNQLLHPIDSVQIKRGVFMLNGKINTPMPVVLKLNDSCTLPLILEPGKIEIAVNTKHFEDSEVKGSTANLRFNEAFKQMAQYRARLKQLDERYQRYFMLGVQNQQLYNQLNIEQAKINAEQTEAAKQLVKQFPNELVSAAIVANYLGNLLQEELEPLYNSLSACVRAQPSLAQIDARLNAERMTGIGTLYREIALPTTAGDTLRLSSYMGKGKCTLLIFWASWCGHCQQEMPGIVDLYKQNKDRGLEIFAVSGDTDKAAWASKIADAQMTFANVSDLRGFDSEAFKSYYVQGIPYMVLFDKEGKILAKGNLNQGIKAKIDEVLGISAN